MLLWRKIRSLLFYFSISLCQQLEKYACSWLNKYYFLWEDKMILKSLKVYFLSRIYWIVGKKYTIHSCIESLIILMLSHNPTKLLFTSVFSRALLLKFQVSTFYSLGQQFPKWEGLLPGAGVKTMFVTITIKKKSYDYLKCVYISRSIKINKKVGR